MPRQVDQDERRAAIADAVRRVAAHEGFDAVTIRRTAAEIGASTTAVTHYVRHRDELLRLVVAETVDARRAQLEERTAGRSGAEALRLVLEWAALGPTDDAHRFWLALVLGARTHPVLRAELDRFNSWWSGLLRGLVEELAPAADAVDDLCDAIDVVVDGMILVGFEEPVPWSAQRRRRVLALLLAPLTGP